MNEGEKLQQVEHMRTRFAKGAPARDTPRREPRMDQHHGLALDKTQRRLGRQFLDFAVRAHRNGAAARRVGGHDGGGVGQHGPARRPHRRIG